MLLKRSTSRSRCCRRRRHSTTDGRRKASVGGLLIEFARDVQGLPPRPRARSATVDPTASTRLTVQLGLTGALGSAANYGVDDDVLDDRRRRRSTTSAATSPTAASASTTAARFDTDAGGLAGAGARTARPRRQRRTGGTLVRQRSPTTSAAASGFLYLALMFTVLALCIAPRLAVPARLPGHQS